MKCSNCGAEMSGGNFCTKCGSKLEQSKEPEKIKCCNCGAVFNYGIFCPECGKLNREFKYTF